MEHEFSRFCTCTQRDYAFLMERVNTCADHGHSYEFPNCQMPEGCSPSACTVGFWRDRSGYLLYFRPALTYQGQDDRLSHLFSRESWHFDTFPQLSATLAGLRHTQAAHREYGSDPLFLRLRTAFQEFIFGQDDALNAVAFKLYGHLSKRCPRRPLSLIFYGPTGVGKSELAKGIAPVLDHCCPGQNHPLVWTELNTFTQPHSAYRLTGAPPGYVGYDDPPILEAVRTEPHTVFVFDELEKAHPEILKIFMSILDEGRCTARQSDASGSRELDFRHCIFIFTTNLDLSVKRNTMGFTLPDTAHPSQCENAPGTLARRVFTDDETARQALVRCGVLKEIAGRFSGLIRFRELSEESRISVTAGQIMALGREYGLSIAGVVPALARALTPRDAFSARSTAAVLEGVLTPLFLAHAGQHVPAIPLWLTGTPQNMKLLPAY